MMRRSDGPAKAAMFYVIAFGLAFILSAHFASALGEAVAMVTMLTPAAAVVIMLAVTGEARSPDAWASLGVARAGVKGWPLAILGPVIILVASYGILIAVGIAWLVAPEASRPAAAIATGLAASLAIGVALAFGEEVGWRGYMLPRLAPIGLVPAMLIVGLAHGVWHLPLMLLTPYYHSDGDPLIVVPLFIVTLTLAGIFYGYLRIWTGSVWPVAIAHGVYNFVWNLGSEFVATSSPDTMEYVGGESGILVIVGLVVAALILVPRLRNRRLDQAGAVAA
jgi:membrane protease YdiL (CAAX protease family)